MKKYKLKKIFRPDWTKGNNRNKKLLWLDKNENTDELLLNDISKIINGSDLEEVIKLGGIEQAKMIQLLMKYSTNKYAANKNYTTKIINDINIIKLKVII